MAVGGQRGNPAARGALQVAVLNQVGFDHVFNRVAFFTDGGSQAVQPDRAAVEFVDDGVEQLAVHDVQAGRVNVQHGQGAVRDVLGDLAARLDLGIVAHAAQQAVGDARRAARALRNLQCAAFVNLGIEQTGAALDNGAQLGGGIELQAGNDAEAVPQRIGQHARAGRGANQGERLQVKLDAARGGPFANQDVDLEIFQRGVEDFLNHRR